MDFIEILPWSDGYTMILVAVDRLSKYTHIIPLQHPYNVVTVAAAFMQEMIHLHEILELIVTN